MTPDDLPLIPTPHHDLPALTPAQRRGLAYQRRVGKWLHANWTDRWEIIDGPWLVGPCQPDFILLPRNGGETPTAAIVVIETKLTQCDCSHQLMKYRRALQHLAPVVTIQIARRITTAPTASLDPPQSGTMLLYV
jgi:hypothetical protein